MPRVTHFEISADEPDRAVKFYRDVFGWKIEKWEGSVEYWLITTGPDEEPGINGGIGRRMHPHERTRNSIDVPSVDEFTKKITDSGGKIVVQKMAIPGVGYIAYCEDTERNVFGIMEEDTSAR